MMGTNGIDSGRIRLFDGDGLTPEQKAIYDTVINGRRGKMVGPLRAALHSPELADRWSRFGEHLRYNTSLTTVQSELAILVVARHWSSDTEWAIHADIARAVGLDAAIIDSIRRCALPPFVNPDEALIYEFARQLLQTGHVRGDTYSHLHQRFEDVWLVELTALIGYYSMVAMTLNAHRIPRPHNSDESLLPVGKEPSRLPELSADVIRKILAAAEPVGVPDAQPAE
ncbi:carboxymuconolactone decarboxylase family protein [Rhizobium sp. CRIBSB]|nr:carboxymuconolactone decarboxylase family protein [Rhizobium sp. CRIBSB]